MRKTRWDAQASPASGALQSLKKSYMERKIIGQAPPAIDSKLFPCKGQGNIQHALMLSSSLICTTLKINALREHRQLTLHAINVILSCIIISGGCLQQMLKQSDLIAKEISRYKRYRNLIISETDC